MDINVNTLAIMIIGNGLVFWLTYRRLPKDIFSIYYLLIALTTFIYSGYGMCYESIGADYLWKYMVFYTVYLLTLFFCRQSHIRFNNHKLILSFASNSQRSGENCINNTETLSISKHSNGYFSTEIINCLAFVFFLTYLIFLIIPTNRLYMLFSPPTATVIGGYDRIELANSNGILDLATTIRSLTLPFFMLFLKRKINQRKYIVTVLYILLWLYLQFLSECYIGRSELIVFTLFVLVIIENRKRDKFFISKKFLTIAAILVLLAVPLLLSYQYARQGQHISATSYTDALNLLASTELTFPKYYCKLTSMMHLFSPLKYFAWLFLLPIPSLILPQKGEITLLINRVFSTQILGVAYGKAGYTGLLPSIFGEAILLYGEDFYFVHAIILAMMIYGLYKLLLKYPELEILNLYFAISSLTIARGGSQGFFGTAVNALFFYVVITKLYATARKKRQPIGL